ncbi:hypothetical protein Tco_1384649 [Tanacetum coccineum]
MICGGADVVGGSLWCEDGDEDGVMMMMRYDDDDDADGVARLEWPEVPPDNGRETKGRRRIYRERGAAVVLMMILLVDRRWVDGGDDDGVLVVEV